MRSLKKIGVHQEEGMEALLLSSLPIPLPNLVLSTDPDDPTDPIDLTNTVTFPSDEEALEAIFTGKAL